ncbi:MAG: GNAT family N-acetyltransferase [bacterium]|nr:GNAT family N-acetyltransferase [bacterium]
MSKEPGSILLDEACSTSQLRTKVAVLCLPGLQSFLGDIVDFLKTRYEVRTCYTNNNQEIESAVRWADTVWLEWANELAIALTNHSTILDGKRVICRLHSYEAFAGYVQKIRWERIDDLIFVAGHIKDIAASQVLTLPQQVKHIHIVPNGINMDKFIFKERKKGNNIAYLGYINYKKGPMLLLHAFRELVQTDNRYRLFIAGDFQEARYKLYFDQMIREMGLEGNIQMCGWIEDVGIWLEDKQHIVCTSVLEGHPIGLMEAMACGLKPVIHNYVGAKVSYPAKYLWNTIPEFVQKVTEDDYNSTEYREFIEQNYSLDIQLKKIEKILRRSGKVEQISVQVVSNIWLEDKLREGEGLFADGRIEEAERCFLSIAEQNPQSKEVFNNLGVIAFGKNELEKAVDFFSRSLRIDPFYKNAALNFSDVLKELNKLPEIIPALEKIIARYPEDKELSELLKEARLSKSQAKRQFSPADSDTTKVPADVSSKQSDSLCRAVNWIKANTVPNEGIIVSTRNKISYPEVTGYLIPTLYKAGERELAFQFAQWLATVQQPNGSFLGPGSKVSFAFDTGQIIRGLVTGLDDLPELEQCLRRACDWIVDNSSTGGRLPVPSDENAWSIGNRGTISEGVHLYVLPPLMEAGEKLNEPRYVEFAKKSLDYYLKNVELTNFQRPNMLTHLFLYIQEALCDLGVHDVARKGMQSLAPFQWDNGGIPAYSDVAWVCSPGQAQAAIVWYKLGENERADLTLSFMEPLQNPSGGFFGSYGVEANYFPNAEISWAVKFYLDAFFLAYPDSSHSKRRINQHLDPDSWHQAIVGESSAKSIANRIKSGHTMPWLKAIIENTAPGQRVLELGSGTGELSAALALQGRQVTLLDFSPKSLEFSQEIFQFLEISGEFQRGDVLQKLPFPDNMFDCVWSSGLLEHFDDGQIVSIIRESARVSHGKVISLVPNAFSIPYRLGKWYQEKTGSWRWGKETPKLTLRPYFERAGLLNISEVSIAPEHALQFLISENTLRDLFLKWYRSIDTYELEELNQGYLLLTVGYTRKPRHLAVVPNDPLQAYVDAGYPDLTDYFNPKHFFDKVYCLSPQETKEISLYGMKVIPTPDSLFGKRLKELEIDVIRAYDLKAGQFAYSNKAEGIPIIISVHDVNPNRVPREIPRADCFLAISRAVEDFLIERGVPQAKIRRFANRVDTEVFRPITDARLREQFKNRYPGQYRILHVGRRSEQKNLDTLIKTLASLGKDYVAIFVGKGDSAPYKNLAVEQGVIKQCYFVDSVPNEELAQYYSFCDCMCTPSRWEGFGIVFIEALACECVVVTSDISPMNEYIRNGISGILVSEFENPIAIAENIQNACTSSDLRAVIQANARFAARPFSKEKVSQREVYLYKEFVTGEDNKIISPVPTVSNHKGRYNSDLKIIPLQPDMCKEWDNVARNSPDAWLYHLYDEQLLLEEAWHVESHNFLVKDRDKIVAICPLQRHLGNPALLNSTILGPAGPALTPNLESEQRERILNYIYSYLREKLNNRVAKAIGIFVPPLSRNSLQTWQSGKHPLVRFGFQDSSTQTMVISLEGNLDDIFHKIRKGHRSAINKAMKAGIEIYQAAGVNDINDYYKLHCENYIRTGVRPHVFAYFEKIWEYFGTTGLAMIFLARYEGRCVGATNIAHFKDTTLYWTGAYSEEGLKIEAGKLLQWEAIQWAHKAGVKWHEIGEVFPNTEKGSKLAGLTTYKRGFGGELHPFYKGMLVG